MWLLHLWLSVLTLAVVLEAWVQWRHRRYFLALEKRLRQFDEQFQPFGRQVLELSRPFMEDGTLERVDEMRRKWGASDSARVSDVQAQCEEFLRGIEKAMGRPKESCG